MYRLFGIIISALAGILFITLLTDNLKNIPKITWDASTLIAMALSVLLFGFSVSINGLIWKLLLSDHKIAIKMADAQGIVLVAQFGKYLPGNIGHHLGRIYLAKKSGIPLFAVINTMLQETLWSVGIGAGLSAIAIAYYIERSDIKDTVNLNPLVLASLFLLAIVLPWLVVRAINTLAPELAKKITDGKKLPEPSRLTALGVSGLYVLCFFIMALVLKIQIQLIFEQPDVSVLHLTGVFSIVWIAGYLAPGAPAGLGVREAMLVLLLTPLLGVGIALGVSVTLRIATILGDGLALLIGFVLRKMYMRGK